MNVWGHSRERRALAAPGLIVVAGSVIGAGAALGARAPSPATGRVSVIGVEPASGPMRYGKLEIVAKVDTAADVPFWPYDAAPPAGIPAGRGVSLRADLVDPAGREYSQPGFFYRRFEQAVRKGRDWRYPTDDVTWRVRVSPTLPGTWKYRLVLEDRGGTEATAWRTVTVAPSAARGFVRVSRADTRYFEFDDGTMFSGLGFAVPEHFGDPVSKGAPMYQELGQNGVNFARLWVGSLFGSAWTPWVGGRNRYAGYLPVAGLVPFTPPGGESGFAMRLDYEPGGDTGWFDACRLEWANEPTAIKPRTRYRVGATYAANRVSGPRVPRSADYGLVVKVGGMFPTCHEPGTSHAVTGFGRDAAGFGEVTGTWRSGDGFFLPKLHVALENVTGGAAYVRSLSVREAHPDGGVGPEILDRPSMQFDAYVPQSRALALDTIVALAGRHGVYLKLVVMEKDDEIYQKRADHGGFVTDRDNRDGVYGLGRPMNATRWLQQAWWRYLQARWGYSPSIHSWELVNEGDPGSVRHYEAADEFGKYMHFGVFGRTPAPGYDHPNDHLVTTSFWHSFPAAAFWANPSYRHVDYADLHAYVSTSFAPAQERVKMAADPAYYHTWHSQAVAAARLGKPVVRGEAGLDVPGRQDEHALGLDRDTEGDWLHDFLWSGLHSGGLYELYWWRSHISGPQGDHRSAYRLIGEFLAGLDLNKGGYADWGGTVAGADLGVVGQKNVQTGRLHLWIRNERHTWRAIADRAPIPAASGTVRIPGFTPRGAYRADWWDTWAAARTVTSERVVAGSDGAITLDIDDLARDVALSLVPAMALHSAE